MADALRAAAALEWHDWTVQVPAGMYRNAGDVPGLFSSIAIPRQLEWLANMLGLDKQGPYRRKCLGSS